MLRQRNLKKLKFLTFRCHTYYELESHNCCCQLQIANAQLQCDCFNQGHLTNFSTNLMNKNRGD